MIKKLKIKIVIAMMALITLLLGASFAGMYVLTSRNIADQSMIAMENAAEKPRIGFFSPDDASDNGYFSIITIDINERDKTFTIDGYGVSSVNLVDSDIDYINMLISAVKSQSKDTGIIQSDGYNYRYLSREAANITRIVLLDKGYETQTLRSLLISQAITGTLSLIAFLFVTIFIANIAISPAESSWRQQKQLVADASHELKTPITVISANTDIILENPNSTVKEQEKWLGYIKAETSRMAELVNNMLYLAKSEDGNSKPVLDALNFSDLTTEIVLPFESICFEKEKNLLVNILPDVYIKGDAPSLRQLISILLDNACKYSDTNGQIEVFLYPEGDKAVLVVRNSGEPIPREDINKIFERFYRVNKARSRTEGGYGLGLSIAKTIVNAHGGKITVTSSSQDGTIFKCIFRKHAK